MFEHFDYLEVLELLRDWRRILKPRGSLVLELPNLAVCIREIGKHFDEQGYDLAMAGIFSYPPFVRKYGMPMIHKWGWTPESLSGALRESGFSDVQQQPVKQTWRLAAAFGRDMQIVGIK